MNTSFKPAGPPADDRDFPFYVQGYISGHILLVTSQNNAIVVHDPRSNKVPRMTHTNTALGFMDQNLYTDVRGTLTIELP